MNLYLMKVYRRIKTFKTMEKKDIFDTEISVYNGVRDVYGTTCKLRAFLFDKKHISEIEQLRSLTTKEERNEIKKKLPQACLSGIFSPTRKSDNLVRHSGLICVDIDRQDNLHIDNWDKVKQELSKLPQIAYISLSVSGNGYFVIIPLRYPDYHKGQFEQLKRDFAQYGLIIDHACGDIARMRCLSYDVEPYINTGAIPYEGYYVEPRPVVNYRCMNSNDTLDKVARCCEQIETNHIDITGDYQSWFTVGCALASLGENGRPFFHICSKQNQEYKYNECEKKFNNLLRTIKNIGIGSFFEICKDYGITPFKDDS